MKVDIADRIPGKLIPLIGNGCLFSFSRNKIPFRKNGDQTPEGRSEYQKQLAFGAVADLDASIKEFNDKLYAAGLQDIMDAKQEQLNAWLAENK